MRTGATVGAAINAALTHQDTHRALIAAHVAEHADRIAPGQRAHLQDVATLPGVSLATLPPVALTCRASFTIFSDKLDGCPALVDIEMLHGDLRLTHPHDASLYELQFTQLAREAEPTVAAQHASRDRGSSAYVS